MSHRASLPEFRVEALSRSHDRESFSCGNLALDLYLQRQARQDISRKLTSVHVFTDDGKRIAAYYTLSACSISRENLPAPLAAKLPQYPLPVTLLGRMAVDGAFQGRGLGSVVLVHALQKALASADLVASMAVIVDAKDGVAAFYLRHGFKAFPSQPQRMFLLMEDVRKLL